MNLCYRKLTLSHIGFSAFENRPFSDFVDIRGGIS